MWHTLPSSPSNAVTVVPFLNLMPLPHAQHPSEVLVYFQLQERVHYSCHRFKPEPEEAMF